MDTPEAEESRMKKQTHKVLQYVEREMKRGYAAGGGNPRGVRFKRLMEQFRRSGSSLKGLQ